MSFSRQSRTSDVTFLAARVTLCLYKALQDDQSKISQDFSSTRRTRKMAWTRLPSMNVCWALLSLNKQVACQNHFYTVRRVHNDLGLTFHTAPPPELWVVHNDLGLTFHTAPPPELWVGQSGKQLHPSLWAGSSSLWAGSSSDCPHFLHRRSRFYSLWRAAAAVAAID